MKSNYNGINEINDIKLNDNLEFEKNNFAIKLFFNKKKLFCVNILVCEQM